MTSYVKSPFERSSHPLWYARNGIFEKYTSIIGRFNTASFTRWTIKIAAIMAEV
jgi:hypothetical protein